MPTNPMDSPFEYPRDDLHVSAFGHDQQQQPDVLQYAVPGELLKRALAVMRTILTQHNIGNDDEPLAQSIEELAHLLGEEDQP